MPLFRRVYSRVVEDRLLLILLLALPVLLLVPGTSSPDDLPGMIHWQTIAALTGLMILSRGLEESGGLARAGGWMLARVSGERGLAMLLVVFSALLAAVVTNDVALFIVVPITLGLRTVTPLPVGRLVIFEALAVNAGSTLSPVGNPQNLFLWQITGVSFLDFTLAMLPIGLALLGLLLLMVPIAFPARTLALTPGADRTELRHRLLMPSLLLYPVFLVMLDQGYTAFAVTGVMMLYLLIWPRVMQGVDWLILLVFVLMFAVLGLLAQLPWMAALASAAQSLPGGTYTGGVLVSQAISNVPATIFLEQFTAQWQALAWGVNVGGFGLAIGSMANLIALRLARRPGLWGEFHAWSVPLLAASWGVGLGLGWLMGI